MTRRPRVLLLGGDASTRRMLLRVLPQIDAEPVIALDPGVLSTVARGAFDLLLLVAAPGGDALALLAPLPQTAPPLPFVVLAVAPSWALRLQAFARGARDVISLPARDEELCVRLRVALPRRGHA